MYKCTHTLSLVHVHKYMYTYIHTYIHTPTYTYIRLHINTPKRRPRHSLSQLIHYAYGVAVNNRERISANQETHDVERLRPIAKLNYLS